MSLVKLKQEDRERIALYLAWFLWSSTAVLVALRSLEIIPQHSSSAALLTIGGAVAASLTRGRMRLTTTITRVFEAGLKVGLDAGSEKRLAKDVAEQVTEKLESSSRQSGSF